MISHRHSNQHTLLLLFRRATDFHPRILYLTGTQEQLAKVTKGYRVYFSKVRSFAAFLVRRRRLVSVCGIPRISALALLKIPFAIRVDGRGGGKGGCI